MSTHLTFPARTWVKSATDEREGIVDAIVSVTGVLDRQKDIVEPGAFRKALTGKLPKVVNSHQAHQFLGKVLSMRELQPGNAELPSDLRTQGRGALATRMKFNLETQSGAEMYSNVRGGFVDEWSYMFSIEDSQYDSKGARHIKLIDEVFEVSPVLVGAGLGTRTLATKAASMHTALSGYCLKDMRRVSIQNPRAVTMTNGETKTAGNCPHCGTKVYAQTPLTMDQVRKRLAAHGAAERVGKRALWDLWLNGEIEGPVQMPDDYNAPNLGRYLMHPEGTRFDN